jgi:hypothetical protein
VALHHFDFGSRGHGEIAKDQGATGTSSAAVAFCSKRHFMLNAWWCGAAADVAAWMLYWDDPPALHSPHLC